MMHKKKGRLVLIIVLMLITILLLFVPICGTLAESDLPVLKINYFFTNVCSSCNEKETFIDKFNTYVGLEKNGVELQLNMYNLLHEGSDVKLKEFCDKYGISSDIHNEPILFMGDTYLLGSDEIDNRLKDEFIKAKTALLKAGQDAVSSNGGDGLILKDSPDSGVNKGAEAGNSDTTAITPAFKVSPGLHAADGTDTALVYFYVSSCKDCGKVKNVLDSLQHAYDISVNDKKVSSTVRILRYNIGELKNLELIKMYFKAYDIQDKDRKVPLVFIGRTYITGAGTTLDNLEGIIKRG